MAFFSYSTGLASHVGRQAIERSIWAVGPIVTLDAGIYGREPLRSFIQGFNFSETEILA
jgi:hypothetical protein